MAASFLPRRKPSLPAVLDAPPGRPPPPPLPVAAARGIALLPPASSPAPSLAAPDASSATSVSVSTSAATSSANPATPNAAPSTLALSAADSAPASAASTAPSTADGGIGACLVAGMPGGALARKQGGASSLYQDCLRIRDRLWHVDGFGPAFLAHNPPSDHLADADAGPTDPVSQLWYIFRLGLPLCVLFNHLGPLKPLPTDLFTPEQGELWPSGYVMPRTHKQAKKFVAQFVIAASKELGIRGDDSFFVSHLFSDSIGALVGAVKVVSLVLDELEARGKLLPESQNPRGSETAQVDATHALPATDERAAVVRELLETERQYVQHLERLQAFAKLLYQKSCLSADTLHNIFCNLDHVVDVQRRLLICFEENARRPLDDQHFGAVFIQLEKDLCVYEPFCGNYRAAIDICRREAANIMAVKSAPEAADCYIDPVYEAQSFLIKPVQRICKYPLMLEQIIQRSPAGAPNMDELRLGLSCIKKVVEWVNELQRIQDNLPAVKDLEARVEDWKGHNINTFGDLILHDTFTVHKGDIGREYNVFLFSKILLCCKDAPAAGSKKKQNALLAKPQKPAALQHKGPLQLKGRIFLNNVTAAMPYTGRPFPPDSYNLQVFWRGDTEQESFVIECRTEEELRTWMSNINRLMDEAAQRRQRAYMAQLAGAAGAAPPSSAPSVLPPMPFTPGGSRPSFSHGPSTAAGQLQFPPAAVADHPGYFALAGADGRPTPSPMPPSTPGGLMRFEDRLESLRHDTVSSPTFQSRSTPLGFTLPPGVQPGDLHLPDGRTRQRSNTEDPRLVYARNGAAHGSTGSVGARPGRAERLGDRRPSVPATRPEGAVPFPPMRTVAAHPLATTSSRASAEEERSSRLRSASSPQHAYHLPGPMQHPAHAARTVPAPTHHAHHHHIRGQSQGHPARPSLPSSGVPPATPAPVLGLTGQVVASPLGYVPSARPTSAASTAETPTSPGALSSGTPVRGDSASEGSSAALLPSYVVTVGIRYEHEAEAALTQVVMASIGYEGLRAKVTEKVRVCVGPHAIPPSGLKLKYVDEDGDKVHMQNNEDVSLAFEGAKAAGGKVEIVICS